MAGKKDIVEQALKMVMGEGSDAAKAGIRAYHGTPQPTENLIDLFHGTNPEAFDAITSSGDIFGSSRFSPRRDVAETFAHNVGGNANTVVKVKAPASSLMVDLDLPAAKLLTPDEAAAYLDKPDWTILDFIENGYSVGVPDTSVLSIERASGGSIREGYGPGGWVDDVVKMAGKVISGEGEGAAKAGIRAYHGTPHDFDRFEWSPRTRGTGEGAQAYGDGLYFAGNEDIARHYRDALSGNSRNAVTIGDELHPHWDSRSVSKAFSKIGYDPATSVLAAHLIGKSGGDLGKIAADSRIPEPVREAISKVSAPPVKGHMYEVEINADPDAFLDWDKPLSEQPEAVRSALTSFGVIKNIDKMKSRIEMLRQAGQNDAANEIEASLPHYEKMLSQTGDELHQRMFHEARRELGGQGGAGAYQAQVAEKLREAGIPGIKYLDAGSRGAGDGTRNYVVFDDKLISIIRKYGIAGASAMLGYNLMEQLDPKQALAASMADQDYQASRPQKSMGGNNSISGALNVARGLNGGR